jgi:hypothetical protein
MELALTEGHGLSVKGARTRASRSDGDPDCGSQADDENRGGKAAPKPRHQKCGTCPRFDDDWDPVDLARGLKHYMWWGKPCSPKGETVGLYCGYCLTLFCAKFRHIRTVTMQSYASSLGCDPKKMSLHLKMVELTIEKCIEKGGKRRTHFDWTAIEDRSGQTVFPSYQPQAHRPWYLDLLCLLCTVRLSVVSGFALVFSSSSSVRRRAWRLARSSRPW